MIQFVVPIARIIAVLTPEKPPSADAECGSRLINRPTLSMVWRPRGRGLRMASRLVVRFTMLAVVLMVAGCASTRSTGCQCPQLVKYDDATIKKITAALRALPPDNVLHQAMDDYENERDDLRACLAAAH